MKEKVTSMRDLEYENVKSDKIARILGIYTKLMNGGIVNKAEEARQYGVNERSIQRDIDDIREYFENETADIGFINSVTYDRSAKGYRLEQLYKTRLSNSEILAVCKILLDSRAFTKKEMLLLLDKLVECCVPQTNQNSTELEQISEIMQKSQTKLFTEERSKDRLDTQGKKAYRESRTDSDGDIYDELTGRKGEKSTYIQNGKKVVKSDLQADHVQAM